AMVEPNDVSAPAASNAATSTLSLGASLPAAKREPAGPTPSMRSSMYRATTAANTLTAIIPPRIVRFHETWGLARTASVAIVPRTLPSDGVPPGVNVGVAVAMRWETYCVYAVNRMTGSPSAMTASAPGNTQSGSPIAMIAARATSATPRNAAAYTANARASMPRPPNRIAGIAACGADGD